MDYFFCSKKKMLALHVETNRNTIYQSGSDKICHCKDNETIQNDSS